MASVSLAAVHVHSNWSYDGKWTLSDLARRFRARGCSYVFMTEHDRGFSQARFEEYRSACHVESSSSIVLVPGIEYSDAGNAVHVLTWGLEEFLGEGRETGELLRDVRSRGGVAVLAHPTRRQAWHLLDPGWMGLLDGVEVWNRKTDGWCPSRDAKRIVQEYKQCAHFVGLDFHTSRQGMRLFMRIEISGGMSVSAAVSGIRKNTVPLAWGLSETVWDGQACKAVLRCADKLRRGAAALVRRQSLTR